MNWTDITVLEESISRVENYFRACDYRSYDLCDIKARKFFLKWDERFTPKKYGKYARYPVNKLIEGFPRSLRRVLGIRKSGFAQSHALFIRGYCIESKRKGEEHYLREAEAMTEFMLKQRSPLTRQLSWGQPYDWFSGRVIHAHTPRTTVTSQVMQALMDLYESTNNPDLKDHIKDAGLFFVNEMKRSWEMDDEVCFSYTIIDDHRVFNANMMAAAALIRAGKLLGWNEFSNLGIRCMNYCARRQNTDGSWYYYELPSGRKSKIDNYHTGYVLEAFAEIKRHLGNSFPYERELIRGIKFYRDNFFFKNEIPKMTPESIYPIDIQSCAQSIITFVALSEIGALDLHSADKILAWTMDHFYDDEGRFYYRINQRGQVSKLSYIRWGDAWMHLALLKYINAAGNE